MRAIILYRFSRREQAQRCHSSKVGKRATPLRIYSSRGCQGSYYKNRIVRKKLLSSAHRDPTWKYVRRTPAPCRSKSPVSLSRRLQLERSRSGSGAQANFQSLPIFNSASVTHSYRIWRYDSIALTRSVRSDTRDSYGYSDYNGLGVAAERSRSRLKWPRATFIAWWPWKEPRSSERLSRLSNDWPSSKATNSVSYCPFSDAKYGRLFQEYL